MQRLTLKQMILNEVDKQPRGYIAELASIAGYYDGSNLKKVLKDEIKEFDKVNGLLKIVQTLFPKDELEIMSNYALSLDFNKHTARCMLEYAEINRLADLRTKLIFNMKESSNAQSKQIATMHEIDMKLTSKDITYLEALSLLENISVKTVELQCLKMIYKSYCYLEVQLHDSAILVLKNIDELIMDMKDDYFKDVILGRYYSILAECLSRKGEIEASRKFAFKLLQEVNIPYFSSWGHLHLGNSYLLEDYDKSNHYLVTGKGIVDNKKAIKNINRSLNFLDNLWKKEPRNLDLNSQHTSDLHEIVFYYINHNQITMAKNLLDKENIEEITENQKGFHWYLRGLISNDISDFSESVIHFKNSGDKRYCQLPLIELKKLNVPDCIIRAMNV